MPPRKAPIDQPEEDDGPPQHMFITQTGPTRSKSASTQVKKFVMKDIGKARRKPPIQTTLEFTIWNPNSLEELANQDLTSNPLGLDVEAGTEAGASGAWSSALGMHQSWNGIHHPRDIAGVNSPQSLDSTSRVLYRGQPMSQDSVQMIPQIERVWTGRLDPFCEYPIEMDQRSLQLLDHLFDDRYGNCPPFRDLWLPLGLLDPAGFLQLLCNACLNLECLRLGTNPPENLEAMKYHNRAVQSINQRISDPEIAKTDGFLGSIIAFGCYFHATGDLDQWSQHIKGASEIVAMRGGWETVFANQSLAMVFYWCAASGAATIDIPSLFEIPYIFLPPIAPQALSYLTPQGIQISLAFRLRFPAFPGPELLTILHDTCAFKNFLQAENLRTNGAIFRVGYFASAYMMPLMHRLLSLADQGGGEVLQAVRIAALLSFTECRRLFGVMGVHCGILTRKLKVFLEMSAGDWNELELLRLWCLAMGGMESDGEERAWFLAELTREKGMLSWEEATTELRGVIWYADVHDVIFAEFCAGRERFKALDDMGIGSRFGGYRPLPD